MDVYITKTWEPSGATLATMWDNCTWNQDLLTENHDKHVVPWANKRIKDASTTVHKHNARPRNFEPGIHFVLNPGEDVQVNSATIESAPRGKSRLTRKQFEAKKREGAIVLNPTLKFRGKAIGTPSISSANVWPKPIRQTASFRKFGANDDYRPCTSWISIPELSLQTVQDHWFHYMEWKRDVYAAEVTEAELRRCLGDIVSYLGREKPDSTLVTQTVAEANSATFDIATEIGEMPETIRMIVNGVIGGIKLLLRFKKDIKQNLSSGSVVTDTASLWMMYRYGLMPIVYSVNDGLELLAMEAKRFQSFRGRVDFPAPEFNLPGGYELVSGPQVQHRCFLKYGYDLDSVVHQGLKINLAATAWELIPLSFVWDWFFQVGDYLTAMFTPGVVNQIGCTYSYRCNGTYVWKNDKDSVITADIDYYRSDVIKPDSFIGINSDVFVSFKRSMDAISLSWLLFKKGK